MGWIKNFIVEEAKTVLNRYTNLSNTSNTTPIINDTNIVINIECNSNGDMETEKRGDLNYILNATCSKTFDEIVTLWRNRNIGVLTVNVYKWGSVITYTTTTPWGGLNFRNKDGELFIYNDGEPDQITVCYGNSSEELYLYIWQDGITIDHGREE